MNTTMPTHVNYTSFKPAASAWRGVAAVVVLHVLLFAALYSGLGAKLLKKDPVVVVAQLSATPEPRLQQPSVPTDVQPVKPQVKAPATLPVVPPVMALTVQSAPVMPVPVSATVSVPAEASAEQTPVSPAVATLALSAPVAVAVVREPAKLQASGNCKKPEYPAISRNKEEQGSVQLLFLIGIQGQVLDSKIEKSSGFARLDDAARAALAQCQFKPGSVDGKPEPSWAHVKYTWRLN